MIGTGFRFVLHVHVVLFNTTSKRCVIFVGQSAFTTTKEELELSYEWNTSKSGCLLVTATELMNGADLKKPAKKIAIPVASREEA